MEKISKSLEDYLKAMVLLGGTPQQSVRPSDIARKMGVSKTSAGKALSSLREDGLVTQPYYGEATLTEEGYQYGLSMIKRHRCLAAFLEQELGIEPEVAEGEAHLMEHAISDDSLQKWMQFIESRGVVVD